MTILSLPAGEQREPIAVRSSFSCDKRRPGSVLQADRALSWLEVPSVYAIVAQVNHGPAFGWPWSARVEGGVKLTPAGSWLLHSCGSRSNESPPITTPP
jgi:hypothetical protein